MVKAMLFFIGFLFVSELDAAVLPSASVLPSETQNIGDLVRLLPAEIESEAQCAEEPNSKIEIIDISETEIAAPEQEVETESEFVVGDLTRPLPVSEVVVPEVEIIEPEVIVPETRPLPVPEVEAESEVCAESEIVAGDLTRPLPVSEVVVPEVIEPESETIIPETRPLPVPEVMVPEVEVIESESESDSEVAVAVPEVIELPEVTL